LNYDIKQIANKIQLTKCVTQPLPTILCACFLCTVGLMNRGGFNVWPLRPGWVGGPSDDVADCVVNLEPPLLMNNNYCCVVCAVESAISAVDESSNLFERCSQIPYCVDRPTEDV
jgi:hypothetical protein